MADADLLAEVWLFRDASKESLEQLAAFAFNKTYAPGDVVFEEGQTGNGLYMITSGKVEVIKNMGAGGLSGLPLADRSTEVIKFLRSKNKNIPIIGVGGIGDVNKALEKIDAGANLIQIYSGFIFKGPTLIKKIN